MLKDSLLKENKINKYFSELKKSCINAENIVLFGAGVGGGHSWNGSKIMLHLCFRCGYHRPYCKWRQGGFYKNGY